MDHKLQSQPCGKILEASRTIVKMGGNLILPFGVTFPKKSHLEEYQEEYKFGLPPTQ